MITTHARFRVYDRLQGIVTELDVLDMDFYSKHLTKGKWYVQVRALNRTHWTDDSVGDTIVCIIQDGNVKTAMLSFASQEWDDGRNWRLR